MGVLFVMKREGYDAMSTGRIFALGMAIWLGFLELLLMLHYVIKIRLGDSREGWNIAFAVLFFTIPVIMSYFIELARKLKD